MILHKYLDADGALKTLKYCELKVTPPNEFNDPFDCKPAIIDNWSDKDIQRLALYEPWTTILYNHLIDLKLIKNKNEYEAKMRDNNFVKKRFPSFKPFTDVSKKFNTNLENYARIACFSSAVSDDKNQILMWSHYANNHQGIRFYFEFNILERDNGEWKPEKVNYDYKRISFKLEDSYLQEDFKKIIESILLTKSEAWQYESEYRVFIQRKNCREIKANKAEKCNPINLNTEKADSKGIFLAKFNPTALQRIDFGVNCLQATKDEIIESVNRPELKHVEIYQSKLDEKEFKLNFEKYKRAT